MDRMEYLHLCQKASMLKSGIRGTKENVPDDLKVIFNGIVYCPVSYELSFNKGQAVHKAILHDLKANSVTYADLSRVDKQE